MSQGIIRKYRNMPPTEFHTFNQRVVISLSDKGRFPDTFWGANLGLFSSYLVASAKHDSVYHESMLGSRVVIAEREVLQAQVVIYLDQIASLLEMAAVSSPDILIASGFDLAKDRRGRARIKADAAAVNSTNASRGEGEGGSST